MDAPDALHFDRFVLDPARGSQFSDGREIRLRPKAFEVLAVQARHAGRPAGRTRNVRRFRDDRDDARFIVHLQRAGFPE